MLGCADAVDNAAVTSTNPNNPKDPRTGGTLLSCGFGGKRGDTIV